MMRYGDTLKNGAAVLAFTSTPGGSVVLADVTGLSAHRFATWLVGAKGETFAGHYYHDIAEAIDDFGKRAAAKTSLANFLIAADRRI